MLTRFLSKTKLLPLAAVLLASIAFAVRCAPAAENDSEPKPPATTEAADAKAARITGIELGEFSVRSDYPAEAQKCTVRFVLYGAVKSEHAADMQRFVEEHRQKIRDVVITATRLTPLNVYQEPDLATFRRHMVVRLRRSLPELMIDDLYLSDFGLLVKSL